MFLEDYTTNITITSHNWDWDCGDGCCSDSIHTLTFGHDGDEYYKVIDCYTDAPEGIEEILWWLGYGDRKKKYKTLVRLLKHKNTGVTTIDCDDGR